MRPAIKNRLVPLAIRDYFELVKRALLVEQDIVDTNQIQEQMGIEKLNKSGRKFLEEVSTSVAKATRLVV